VVNNKPKFLFYWTDEPFRNKEWPKDIMSDEDKRILSILEELPLKLSTTNIVSVCLLPYLVTDYCLI